MNDIAKNLVTGAGVPEAQTLPSTAVSKAVENDIVHGQEAIGNLRTQAEGALIASSQIAENAPSVQTPESKAIDWREVQRPMPIYMFGDSYGSYTGFVTHHQEAGIARLSAGEKLWTGGASHVVYAGDILADRNIGSFQIA